MSSRVDLHLHTTASDGQFSPAEVVRQAIALGMTVIAVTDHDTTEGIAEARETARGSALEVIPGVEISTDVADSEIHILGYYINDQDAQLRRELEVFRKSRVNRAQGMVDKLTRLGLPLEWDSVRQIAGEAAVGRPHVARAMLQRGYVSSMDEAFHLYIGRNGPAYVERYKLTPVEALKIILAADGLPVLAHPLQSTDLVPQLAKSGLVGLEAYYTGYTPEDTRHLLDLAAQYGLLVTGGSDFHGQNTGAGSALGEVVVPQILPQRLAACHRRRQAQRVRTASPTS